MAKLKIIKRSGSPSFEDSTAGGFFASVPDDPYFKKDAASNSRLGHLKRSPAHLLQEIRSPQTMTPAMLIGSAFHMSLLQPDAFKETFDVSGQCRGVTGAGKQCENNGKYRHKGAWYCGKHKPKVDSFDQLETITPGQMNTIIKMRDSVLSHPSAGPLMRGRIYEGSILWTDRETGILCKGRIDNLDTTNGAIVDLKTTVDASKDAFSRSIYTFEYYRQGAMYLQGMRELGVELERFVIIAVEKDPPYAVQVFQLSADVLAAGESELEWLMPLYKKCKEENSYPGYSDKVEPISIEQWAWNKIYQGIPQGWENVL